jgi:hypothetical protein
MDEPIFNMSRAEQALTELEGDGEAPGAATEAENKV